MNGPQRLTVALGALMLAPLALSPAMRADPAQWRALALQPDGGADIVEHGVTADDCRAFVAAWERAGRGPAVCERESGK